MATLHAWLFRYANQIGELSQGRVDNAEHARLKAQQDEAEAVARLNSASGELRRLDSFNPFIGDDYQCPLCWIQDERRSRLKPQSSNARTDLYKCEHCHSEYLKEE